MNPTTAPAADLSAGYMLGILLIAVVLTLLVSLFLVWVYRRSVLRSMRATAKPGGADADSLAQPLSSGRVEAGALKLVTLDHASSIAMGPAASALYAGLFRVPRRIAGIYAIAGSCFAAVMAAIFLLSSNGDFILRQYLALCWIYIWPVVLMVGLVTASTWRARFRIGGGYVFLMVALEVYSLSVSSTGGVGQMALLWLITNLPISLLLLAFLNRKIRAVGPLVLTFVIGAVAGLFFVMFIIQNSEAVRRFTVELAHVYGIEPGTLADLFQLAGVLVLGLFGWIVFRQISIRYERKKISDQSITLDAVWLLFAIAYTIGMTSRGIEWILGGLIAFGVYKVVVWMGFSLRGGRADAAKAPKLLLLRVFSLGKRSERLFDALGRHWRHLGSLQLIAGPDLATTTVEPHEFLDFLRGRLARRFISSPEMLDLRLAEMDLEPDRDGCFRVNEFFCRADTWKAVLARLVGISDAVLMDLRSFSPDNAGCIFEINTLIHTAPLAKVAFLIDETTNEALLRETVQQAWAGRASSPNEASAASLRLFKFTGKHKGELQQLFRTLSVAAAPG